MDRWRSVQWLKSDSLLKLVLQFITELSFLQHLEAVLLCTLRSKHALRDKRERERELSYYLLVSKRERERNNYFNYKGLSLTLSLILRQIHTITWVLHVPSFFPLSLSHCPCTAPSVTIIQTFSPFD